MTDLCHDRESLLTNIQAHTENNEPEIEKFTEHEHIHVEKLIAITHVQPLNNMSAVLIRIIEEDLNRYVRANEDG